MPPSDLPHPGFGSDEPCAHSHPNPAHCPLCGRPNLCQRATQDAYKGSCWCEKESVPAGLLKLVPVEARNCACICRECIRAFSAGSQAPSTDSFPPITLGTDAYLDSNGLLVFTKEYHLRRGYCCQQGCRHCPWPEAPKRDGSSAPA